MKSFIHRVAKIYYDNHGAEISQFTFVFPNRRAGLFFQQNVSELCTQALFSPSIKTINECFLEASSLHSIDRISALFRLYRIFTEYSKSDESFDTFSFWGEILLSDFDDVDKYLVNAEQLFQNISELKELDQLFNIFTPEQIEAIQAFWSNFIPIEEGKSQEEFLNTWKILFPVYREFRDELKNELLGTDAMICRDVVEKLHQKLEIDALKNRKFVFVGFNALNPCEKGLMTELQKRGIADFYWDYEAIEVQDKDNPASEFFAKNTLIFPSKYDIDATLHTESNEKEIELVGIPSAVGQTKLIHKILTDLKDCNNNNLHWNKTAIILPDENLLIPLLHSIPEPIDKINITMGYPLKNTPIAGLMELIFDLHRKTKPQDARFYFENVLALLKHQYIQLLSPEATKLAIDSILQRNLIYVKPSELCDNEIIQSIFQLHEKPLGLLESIKNILLLLHKAFQEKHNLDGIYSLEIEFTYQYYITINRLCDIIQNEGSTIDLNIETLVRFIKQITNNITTPFIGEPLEGLQIMGILESRGLDFENLIIPSFNEGVFPKKHTSNSFIPYNLRRGFELPTYEYLDAIHSYNFYRLISRASKVFFLYDSRTKDTDSNEVSRFFYQLKYHYKYNIKVSHLNYEIEFSQPNISFVQKTPSTLNKLNRFLSNDDNAKALSASSINDYINCPLKFYLSHIEEIKVQDELTDNIESNMFGSIFHSTMEYLYEPYKGKIITEEIINSIIKNPTLINTEIKKSFAKNFFKLRKHDDLVLEGNYLLIAKVISKYITQVFKIDKKQTPFKYISSEEKYIIKLPTSKGDVNIKGIIDRIDEKEGQIRIIDYKTGDTNLNFKTIEELFDGEMEKRPKEVLQTLLYAKLYESENNTTKILPAVYSIRKMFDQNFNYQLTNGTKNSIEDYSQLRSEFTSHLTQCIEEIFNPEIPFSQTKNDKNCTYCTFKQICNKNTL